MAQKTLLDVYYYVPMVHSINLEQFCGTASNVIFYWEAIRLSRHRSTHQD